MSYVVSCSRRCAKLRVPDRWLLTYEAAPVSLNRERNKHWSARSDATREWREAFWALALERQVGRHDRVQVLVHHLVHRGGPLPDIGACYPSVKAGIDGLVDALVIPDDTGTHLIRLTFLPPVRSERDALTLEVRPA
jgi:hypothetical protein